MNVNVATDFWKIDLWEEKLEDGLEYSKRNTYVKV